MAQAVQKLPTQAHAHCTRVIQTVVNTKPHPVSSPCLQIRLGKQHFTSWHGLLGVTTTLAALLVVLMGAGAFRRLGLLQKLPLPMQPLLKRAHTAAGALVWFAALFNVLLGLRTHGAGPRTTLHYGQGIAVLIIAVAQGALLLQRRPAPRAEQEDAGKLV